MKKKKKDVIAYHQAADTSPEEEGEYLRGTPDCRKKVVGKVPRKLFSRGSLEFFQRRAEGRRLEKEKNTERISSAVRTALSEPCA